MKHALKTLPWLMKAALYIAGYEVIWRLTQHLGLRERIPLYIILFLSLDTGLTYLTGRFSFLRKNADEPTDQGNL